MIGPGRAGSAALLLLALCCAGANSASAEAAGGAGKGKKPVCDRTTFRAILDVGHTAEAPGATSARGVKEYEFNLKLAKLIERNLIDAGFEKTLLLVTEGPAMQGLLKRVAIANRASADLFLSIHHDAVPDAFLEKWDVDGTERFYSDRFKGHSLFISSDNGSPGASLAFARLLGIRLKTHGLQYTPHYTERIMGNRQRELVDREAGVYRYDQLIVLKSTHMPAVLLEAGSIKNREEEVLMASIEHQAVIAAAVKEAVESFCAARRPLKKRVPRPAAAIPPANSSVQH